MKHWDVKRGAEVEAPDVDAFLRNIIDVCRKHGMTLGHEDHHGAFEVYRVPATDLDIRWLMNAHIAG